MNNFIWCYLVYICLKHTQHDTCLQVMVLLNKTHRAQCFNQWKKNRYFNLLFTLYRLKTLKYIFSDDSLNLLLPFFSLAKVNPFFSFNKIREVIARLFLVMFRTVIPTSTPSEVSTETELTIRGESASPKSAGEVSPPNELSLPPKPGQ